MSLALAIKVPNHALMRTRVRIIMVKNMYNKNFVLAIKLKNQNDFLPERNDHSVLVPFGSEYSLRLRNKNNRRALVKIHIDGENVSGDGYIINANSAIDLERFYETNKCFKLAALDSNDAIDFGKNGSNEDRSKGVVEAFFWLEKEKPQPVYIPIVVDHHHYHDYSYPWYRDYSYPYKHYPRRHDEVWCGSNNALIGQSSMKSNVRGLCSDSVNSLNSLSFGSPTYSASSMSMDSLDSFANAMPKSLNESREQDVCTVEGSRSNQTFGQKEWIDIEDHATSLTLILRGYVPILATEMPKAAKAIKKHVALETVAVEEVDAEFQALLREEATLKKKLELQKRIKELQAELAQV